MLSLRNSSVRTLLGNGAKLTRPISSSTVRAFSADEHDFDFHSLRKFKAPLQVPKRGVDILHDPLFNKGTAFKSGERDRLRFRGLLPPRRLTMDMQAKRMLQAIRDNDTEIGKNKCIEDLHDRNETLYHRLLVDNIEELAPVIYTPTVGQACKEFGTRFRKPRGMYFSAQDKTNMAAMVYNWPQRDVHVIVVTDGSRILGLGDLGANGMGIPIGKLSLYCAAGGIAPHRVLPVTIDVGTDNEELLKDEFYLGLQHKRIKGQEYFEIVDEFMQAVKHRWPQALVQFEDFRSDVAQPLLNNYRDTHLCFNDDIQGTGATTLAGCLGSLRATGQAVTELGNQRILIAGAGSAGIGVATVLYQAMLAQGFDETAAKNAFFIADEHGLLTKDRTDLNAEQAFFARDEGKGLGLEEIAKTYKPTILLGLTACGGLFKENLIRTMSENCEKPIIFPLSNPTTSAECTAKQAYEWSNGTCVFASGSPFDPVERDGKTYYPTQCNNMFIFPGLGLGASLCGAKSVTDKMLYESAVALANFVTKEELAQGKVFPRVSEIRAVSKDVACSVIREAWGTGIARRVTEKEMANLEEWVQSKMYDPVYVPIVEKPF
ncbi:hypothetical protein TL16_g11793 [Triparma laevis f. inornata]|uniref:Malic enzyme n=2 Tax=Triparma laevis TaxID=1534972 RepID=A0A9W7F467_9STRA|nr:hypothetical protein TL16_g11793 [Triparma laevis f. inornata]GMI02559.1 hypothetical protein TrLO_g8536 [Triparma laevis f. longispina]